MNAGLVKKVEEFLVGQVNPGASALIAVSGGADSVALAIAVAQIQKKFAFNYSLLHIHHGLRGVEADRDQKFCLQLAGKLGVDCLIKSIHPDHYEQHGSIEEQARNERYRLFEIAAREAGVFRIMLGHHADDNVETILYRIIKGTGLRGLKGIPARRLLSKDSEVEIIRPMLACTRQEVLSWLEESGQEYCEDTSNEDQGIVRNYIRHSLLPSMQTAWPGVSENILRLARHAAEALDSIEQRALARIPEICMEPSTSAVTELNASILLSLHPAERACILDTLARQHLGLFYGLLSIHHEQALQILKKGSGRVQLPGEAYFAMESGRFCLYKSDAPAGRLSPLSLEVPGETILPDGTRILADTHSSPPGIEEIRQRSDRIAYVDLDAIQPPLRIRSRQPGDRFRPMGMQRSRKLKEVFIKCKLPRSQRDRIPLIEDRGNIIWIPGIRLAEGFQISESTRRVLRIEVVPAADAVWARTTTRKECK
jgi:tRNA(Ile)-lysidine synthase